jgi:hypothetical protein
MSLALQGIVVAALTSHSLPKTEGDNFMAILKMSLARKLFPLVLGREEYIVLSAFSRRNELMNLLYREKRTHHSL